MEYLTENDIFALEKGILLIYDISNNYPISGNIKTILRSSFSMFGIKILPNGKINYGTLEDDKGTQELKKLIKITADILFYGQYEKFIEDYKNKYNLDNDEFELFKEYRFTSMFLEGFKVMELLNNKRFDLIEKKLNKSDYFKILKYYGIYHNSVFGSYGDFIKSELKNILDKIDNANINALPDTYKYDLEYIKQNVGHTYKNLKK